MALILNDRVRETTAVTGTGSATLLGAVTGYQSFSVIGNGNTTYYTIADQGGPNWEVGLGTYSSGTLARTTVLSSSNSGSLVNFTAGTKDVFVTQPSEKAVYLDGSGNITPSSVGPLTVSSLTDSGLTSGRVTYATTGGLLTDSANMTFNGSTLTSLNSAYTGTLTGGTGVVNLGSGQFYKDASGNVGVGTASPVSASGYGALTVNGTTGSLVYLQNNATSAMQIATNSSGASITAIGASLPLYFSTNSTERMRIDSSGNLLVGTTTATAGGVTVRQHIAGNEYGLGISVPASGAQQNIRFVNGTTAVGSVTTTSSLTTYNTISDYRLKTVIGSIADAGQRIDALEPIEYDWKAGGRTRGFLAHQFAEVYPNSVSGEKDAVDKEDKPVYQSMQASTSEVMADLIAEIQSLRKRVAQLESK